ncbi:surface antigen BspA-like [Trichomonas vaginalis G3]|uniref:Surface antigen BspA-like n=1 Tax=Trichomonas vaginalis (strain ATCC PRA-98 / G3) TaxID=412133 RepID=A2GE48_TRIV3|nr:structural constituent of cell wall [Trichomonas vaginalis G3]EAX84570.1 surface antigen BspA-like [Trichomonas vaginalis G3]KAI5501748.1 structural constituent of cell wall [Trichomonas vaginalis G3]|eukprot:XP_001297500.1 surface antigen BspA-like [Trichomonas vaginalis G3]
MSGNLTRNVFMSQSSKLSSINLPDSIDFIGDYAFNGCFKITEISIPPKIYIIRVGTFSDMKSLKKVNLNHVKNISANGFSLCNQLNSINFGDKLQYICEHAFKDTLLNIDLDFPSSIISIGKFAFSKSSVKSLTFNSENMLIEESAFKDCQGLKIVKLPKNMKVLSNSTFESCKNLETVQFSKNLEIIHSRVFYHCEKLTKVELPESVTKIGDECFTMCSSITEFNLPKSLKYVGDKCFTNMTNLQFVNVISDVEIVDTAFIECHNLKEIKFNSPSISKIHLSYWTNNYTANLEKVSKYLELYAGPTFCRSCKIKHINISCDVREIKSGGKDYVKFEQFTYSGNIEIGGTMSDPSSIDCIVLNKDYKWKLFGQNLSKFKKCGSKTSTTLIIIIVAAILVAAIIIAVAIVCILRKRKTKGFSEIPSGI